MQVIWSLHRTVLAFYVARTAFHSFRLKTKLKYGTPLTTDGESASQSVAKVEQLQQDIIDLELMHTRLQRRVDKLREQESLIADRLKTTREQHDRSLVENTSFYWSGTYLID